MEPAERFHTPMVDSCGSRQQQGLHKASRRMLQGCLDQSLAFQLSVFLLMRLQMYLSGLACSIYPMKGV